MNESEHDYWLANLRARTEETQKAFRDCLVLKGHNGKNPDAVRKDLSRIAMSKLQNLKEFFSPERIPSQILQLESANATYLGAPHVHDRFGSFVAAVDQLASITETGEKLISFCDIFEKYKNDDELTELVDRLIETLKLVLTEGEDHITSKVERDLKSLLRQIEKAKRQGLTELSAWTEIAGRILLEIAGAHVGIPGMSYLVDAAKQAKLTHEKIVSKALEAKSESIRLLKVRSISTNFDELPPLSEMKLAELESAFAQAPRLPAPEPAPPSAE